MGRLSRLPGVRRPSLLVALLALGATAQAQTGSEATAAFDLKMAAAEDSLRQNDRAAAEVHYQEALFQGWMLMASLDRLERRPGEAREGLHQASNFVREDRDALRSLATAYLRSGAAAEAVPILTGLAEKDAHDAESRRLLAKALSARGQTEEAAKRLDEASAVVPDDPEQQFLLATDYLWLKKVDRAERLFTRVIAARPIPQTHVLVGRAYRDAGEYERARGELRAALAQDSGVRRAHYYLGMVTLADASLGPDRAEKAMAEFQEELRQVPDDPSTNDQLGLALLQAGRPAEALPAFETAVRGENGSVFLYHLGRCQLALDRPADALSSSRRALGLAQAQGAADAELQQIHYQLGLALRRLGSTKEATAELAEAGRLAAPGGERAGAGDGGLGSVAGSSAEPPSLTALSPSERLELKSSVKGGLARAYFNLGVLEAQGQQFERAAELFEGTAGLAPDFPGLQASLGVAYFNAKQFDKATDPLRRAVSEAPQNQGLKRTLALSWLNREVWDQAAAVLQDDPERRTNPSLQLAYGLCLLRSHKAAEAEEALSLLLREGGDSAELNVLLGQARAEQGRYEPAIEVLERALGLQPAAAGAYGTLGMIYLRQGRLAEAEGALRSELGRHPGDAESQQLLAEVLERERKPEEAVPLLRSALKVKPDLAGAHYRLGRILFAQGTLEEALGHLEAAVRLLPGNADAHDELGRAYEKLDRKEQARHEFEAARKLRGKR